MPTAMPSRRLCALFTGTVLAGWLGGAATFADGESVSLRYRWNAGDTLQYRITQETDAVMSNAPGFGDLRIKQRQVSDTTMRVMLVEPDGSAHVRWTFDAVRAEVEQPNAGRMVFDSSEGGAGAGDPMQRAMASMVGRSIDLVIGPNGAVRELSGLDDMRSAIRMVLDESPSATIRPAMRAFLSDDALRGQFEEGFRLFPDHPVIRGEEWERHDRRFFPMAGSLETRSVSEFQGVSEQGGRRVAEVRSESSVTLNTMMGPNLRAASGRPMLVGSATGESAAWLELSTGRLVRLESFMRAPLEVTKRTSDGDPFTVTIDCASRLTMELTGSRGSSPSEQAEEAGSMADAPVED